MAAPHVSLHLVTAELRLVIPYSPFHTLGSRRAFPFASRPRSIPRESSVSWILPHFQTGDPVQDKFPAPSKLQSRTNQTTMLTFHLNYLFEAMLELPPPLPR
ncbi:hypothetical protein ONZ45_g8166 [Pleurotus djamor]|nr:hypothetical protein ONZ45_g8166 [Pleurotus djamor]